MDLANKSAFELRSVLLSAGWTSSENPSTLQQTFNAHGHWEYFMLLIEHMDNLDRLQDIFHRGQVGYYLCLRAANGNSSSIPHGKPEAFYVQLLKFLQGLN